MAKQNKRSLMNIITRRKNNPYNDESDLFKKLTRIFSGPIVNLKRQTELSLKRRKLDKFSSKFMSTSGQQFKRDDTSVFSSLQTNVLSRMSRSGRYADFQEMEFNADLASVLDLYADEMTTSTRLEPLMTINCSNAEIKDVLHNLFYNVMNIEYNMYSYCRSLCKFGDLFLYLDVDNEMGIKSVIGLPPEEIERIEGEDESNPNYVQFSWENAGITFENWQIAHLRILGNDKYSPLGTSILDPARRVYRQLTLLEDAVMAYRIVRSPERRVFYIDVGNIAAQDVEQYMQKIVTQMKRGQIVDPTTGKVDLRYNPLSTEEDFYIPVRGASATKIDTLPGGQYTGDIEDVKYLRDKLYAAVKVPMSYLSRGEGASDDKGSLAQKDLRFARTIQRLQRCVVSELTKIGIIHLYILGFRDKDLLSFTLKMNNPSKIAEMQELEHWRTRFDVASAAIEGIFSRRFIVEKFFGMSQEEFLRCQREMFFDRAMDAKLAAIGGGEDGDLGGTSSSGSSSIPDSDIGKDSKDEEEETLLARPAEKTEAPAEPPPGRRDSPTTTKLSKGKMYYPVKSDHRDMGARVRNMKSKYSAEKSSGTNRNLFAGLTGMQSMGKGIYENVDVASNDNVIINENNDNNYNMDTIYNDEEKHLFAVNSFVNELSECVINSGDDEILRKIKNRNNPHVKNSKKA